MEEVIKRKKHIMAMNFLPILIYIQEKVIATLFLLHIFHRIFLVDTWPIIIFITSKCYIQKPQEPIHPFQKRLRSIKNIGVF